MIPTRSSPRSGSGEPLPSSPYPRFHPNYRSRSAARPKRHDDITRPGQERGRIQRGSPVYRHGSPSSSRHASPSPSRRPSRAHRQHSRDHHPSRPRPIPIPGYHKSGSSYRGDHNLEYVDSLRSESVSSVSSSGSLFDTRGAGSGYASSRTSLEDEAEAPKRGRRSPEGRTIRERRLEQRYAGATASALPEDGNSVWSRVATAANSLTVSVSKAWATNVTNNSGEDTPPGEESRLLRAMKAYHLDKARDPSDLPPWLFSEQDRRPVGQLRLASRQDNDGTGSVQSSPLSPSSKSRRLYDAISPTSPRGYTDGVPSSKAASHLKALRDAKRNVLNPTATSPREEKLFERDEIQHRKRAQRRMGMPVGPGLEHGRF